MNKLYELCDHFYSHVAQEFATTQYAMDRMSTQVAALEKSRCNKTILLQGLPPTMNKKVVDANVGHYLSQASQGWEAVAAVHNHQISTANSVVRLEFLTEFQADSFKQQMRATRKYWRDSAYSDHRVKFESDVPTEERLACQPFYALIDLFAELFPQPEFGDIQVWRQTLQIWTPREDKEQRLLAQVAYVLDQRFSRRYSCVLFVHETVYDHVVAHFHAKFTARMRSTMLLIQALKRAVTDRSTSSRPAFDKAFDVSNTTSFMKSFPYPILPNRMSSELAALLESHPMLPFQGAGGLLSVVQQTFLDRGIMEEPGKATGKGKTKSKGKSDTGKGKGKPQGKGKSSTQHKGAWKERDHDRRNDWKWPDDDNDEGWGKSWPKPPAQKGKFPNTVKGKTPKGNAAPQGKKGGKQRVAEVQICSDCSCALGFNAACHTCSPLDPPPGFEYKEPRQALPLVCPAQNDKGEVCYNPLGQAPNCELCKERRKFWSSFQVMTTWPTLPTDKKCESMQLDRILFDLDILTEEPKLYE